jgi:hypothetical protein
MKPGFLEDAQYNLSHKSTKEIPEHKTWKDKLAPGL